MRTSICTLSLLSEIQYLYFRFCSGLSVTESLMCFGLFTPQQDYEEELSLSYGHLSLAHSVLCPASSMAFI